MNPNIQGHHLSPDSAIAALGNADLETAEKIIISGLRDQPQNPQWLRCQMELLSRQGQFAQALSLAEKLVQNGAQDPGLWHTIARLKVSLGDLKGGLKILDTLRPYGLYGDGPIKTNAPLWNGQPINGKTLCIATEGGVGDVICFVRFAKEAAELGAKVVVATYPALFNILKTVPGVDFLIDRDATDRVHFDYWAPALSLPRILDLSAEQITGQPYVKVNPIIKQKWNYLVNDTRPRVGLCWQGRKEFVEDHLRSISAEKLAPLLESKLIAWYKLQLFEEQNTLSHPSLIDLTPHIGCPDQLAAHISCLDLLISVDSGPAHIAGALGTPVWLLNRFFGWITFSCPNPKLSKLDHVENFGEGNIFDHFGTPALWYNSMTIFTQSSFGSWQNPIDMLQKSLQFWVKEFYQRQNTNYTTFCTQNHSQSQAILQENSKGTQDVSI